GAIVLKYDTNLVRDLSFGGVLYDLDSTGEALDVNAATGEVFVGGTQDALGTTFEPKLLALKVNADGRRIDWAATLDNPPPTVTSAAFGIAVKAEGQGTTMVYFTGRRALMPPEQALVLGKLRDEGTTFSS